MFSFKEISVSNLSVLDKEVFGCHKTSLVAYKKVDINSWVCMLIFYECSCFEQHNKK